MPRLQISPGAGFPGWTKFSSLDDFPWLMRFDSRVPLPLHCSTADRTAVFEIRISPLRERNEFYHEI